MIRVPDAASLAAMRVLSRLLGRRVGGSTGTNFFAVCRLASVLQETGRTCSLVTLICDSGDRYAGTYYTDSWVTAQRLDLSPYENALEFFVANGGKLPW
jgi:cysteine synthase A